MRFCYNREKKQHRVSFLLSSRDILSNYDQWYLFLPEVDCAYLVTKMLVAGFLHESQLIYPAARMRACRKSPTPGGGYPPYWLQAQILPKDVLWGCSRANLLADPSWRCTVVSPVNSPHKGQWRGALMFPLICVGINGWINNREAGDLRRHCAHYDVSVMCPGTVRQ